MIWKEQQRDACVIDDGGDLDEIFFCSRHFVPRDRYSSQHDQTEDTAGRSSESFETPPGIGGQRSRFPIPFECEMDIRPMNVEQSNPIIVSFDFKLLLSHAKGFQGFIEASHLHEGNAIKRSGLR